MMRVLSQLYSRFPALFRGLDGKDHRVFGVLVISAMLITGARTIAPFEVGKDQGSQLETAQRFVHGLGLTTTKAAPRDSYNISVVPPTTYLTDWPPGLSLLVVPFLYLGLSLLSALKIVYATVTIIGWIGWAVIVSHSIARPTGSRKTYFGIHLIVLALLPIFLTPGWQGTDIFLWAGIPFILLCLFGIGKNAPTLSAIALAGLLFGALCAMRYTSLFIGLAAMLILFQKSYPAITTFLKRFSVFLVAAFTVLLPLTIHLKSHSQSLTTLAVDASAAEQHLSFFGTFLRDLPVSSSLVLGHPLLAQVIYKLNIDWLLYAVGIITLTIILLWPVFLWRTSAASESNTKDDLALSLSFLPPSLVIFLVAIGVATQPIYLNTARYYEPIALCGVLISYEIATRRTTQGLVKKASQAIVLVFVLYLCVFLPARAFSRERKSLLVMDVLSFTPSRIPKYQSTSQEVKYPSWRLYSEKETSRIKVMELIREYPGALVYAQHYGAFVYDGLEGKPGNTFRPFPNVDFWKRAYTTQPLKVFWVLDQKTPLDFIPASNQKLVFSDSFEKIKILVSDLPAGPIFSEATGGKPDAVVVSPGR